MIRNFIAPAIVALAAMLAISQPAQAQRISVRIGGGPGFYSGGSGYYGGGIPGYYGGGIPGYYGGGIPGYYGRGGSGISIGVYPSSIYGYGPSYYGSSYPFGPRVTPYPLYTEPRIIYVPQTIYVPQAQQPLVPASTTTYVRVFVPDPQARVWFDGNATTSTGTERLYHTPAITPGTNGTYRIRASWQQNGQDMVQEQVVTVNAGQTATVDFTRPVDPFEAPPPSPAK